MHKYIGVLGVVAMVSCAAPVHASIVLDFETVAGGSSIVSAPLVTPLGTVTASASGISALSVFTDTPNTGHAGNFLWHNGGNDEFGQLAFDFNVDSIRFDYSGRIVGVFTATALDAALNVVDTFFDNDTGGDLPGGPITLSGAGIRFLRFGDYPGGVGQVTIDNVEITAPEPGLLLLLGMGLVSGARRMRNRA